MTIQLPKVDHEVMEAASCFLMGGEAPDQQPQKALDKIAAYLIRKETITGREFMIIFRSSGEGMEVSECWMQKD